MYLTGANQFSMRDTVIYTTGTTGASVNVIGVETTNIGSLVSLKTSSISGSGPTGATGNFDIKQPAGITGPPKYCIQLSSTDLLNSLTDGNGFGVTNGGNRMDFNVTGNGTLTHQVQYYLVPGSSSVSELYSSNLFL